jgi:hypothetical protein
MRGKTPFCSDRNDGIEVSYSAEVDAIESHLHDSAEQDSDGRDLVLPFDLADASTGAFCLQGVGAGEVDDEELVDEFSAKKIDEHRQICRYPSYKTVCHLSIT